MSVADQRLTQRQLLELHAEQMVYDMRSHVVDLEDDVHATFLLCPHVAELMGADARLAGMDWRLDTNPPCMYPPTIASDTTCNKVHTVRLATRIEVDQVFYDRPVEEEEQA